MIFKFNHTPYTMTHIIEHVVASSIMNIISKMNYRFIAPQNGPTINEHATQGLHVTMGKTQLTFVHLATPIGGISFPFYSLSLLYNMVMSFGCHYMCTK